MSEWLASELKCDGCCCGDADHDATNIDDVDEHDLIALKEAGLLRDVGFDFESLEGEE